MKNLGFKYIWTIFYEIARDKILNERALTLTCNINNTASDSNLLQQKLDIKKNSSNCDRKYFLDMKRVTRTVKEKKKKRSG